MERGINVSKEFFFLFVSKSRVIFENTATGIHGPDSLLQGLVRKLCMHIYKWSFPFQTLLYNLQNWISERYDLARGLCNDGQSHRNTLRTSIYDSAAAI